MNEADWPLSRKLAYLNWAAQVVERYRDINAALDAFWDQTLAEARGALENEAR